MLTENWEYDVLGVYNYRRDIQLKHYFDFIIKNHDRIDGDIIEAGVFKGKALLGMGLLLKEIGSDKKIFGYDTFAGFPPIYSKWDDLSYFKVQLDEGKISKEHFLKFEKNIKYRALYVSTVTSENISLSGDFSENSIDKLQEKINILGLDNAVLVQGSFAETMKGCFGKSICAVLFDCDLYDSYQTVLNYVWKDLTPGGMLYFDEYYSLKFPGARKSVDDFFENIPQKPKKFSQIKYDFERWGLFK